MTSRKATIAFASALLVVLAFVPVVFAQEHLNDRNGVRHVLLISIDGMHAVDYENCIASNTCPHLAALGKTGVTYTRTTTSRPSDSFPGLMALVTGGTPKTVGAFYDVAYDRVLAPPTIPTGNGLPAGACTPNQINGTQTEYEEGVEFNQHFVNGIGPGGPYSTFDGGVKSINPTRLVRDPFNNCSPVYPWNFVRTNTIYGVIHAAGGYTAWSDKHPVYAVVSGPTGTNSPSNVDDYYAPEVNSDIVPIPNFKTVTGVDCSSIPHAAGDDWTTGFDSIKCYDQLKVNAIVNEINGKTHLGDHNAPVPVILGMNYQAVSVGQKLIKGGVKGGYTDAAGDPTPLCRVRSNSWTRPSGRWSTRLKITAFSIRPPSSSPPSTASRRSIPTASSRFPDTPARTARRPPESSEVFSRQFTEIRITALGWPRTTSHRFGWRIRPTPLMR